MNELINETVELLFINSLGEFVLTMYYTCIDYKDLNIDTLTVHAKTINPLYTE